MMPMFLGYLQTHCALSNNFVRLINCGFCNYTCFRSKPRQIETSNCNTYCHKINKTWTSLLFIFQFHSSLSTYLRVSDRHYPFPIMLSELSPHFNILDFLLAISLHLFSSQMSFEYLI